MSQISVNMCYSSDIQITVDEVFPAIMYKLRFCTVCNLYKKCYPVAGLELEKKTHVFPEKQLAKLEGD